MNFDLKQAKKDQKAGYKKAAKNALTMLIKLTGGLTTMLTC
ncbi:MAG: Hypothetical protein AJITA_01275 [Acetilactobacillus jinshanensis]